MSEAINDVFLTFASGAQALRRRAEAATWGLGGALGVAAEPYPHQLATVHRILTDIRIRHLVADEVGLGKTVQAIMVINALRWQDPGHRTLIVAPDRLIGQWQAELWTRGHVRASVISAEDGERDHDPSVLLLRPRDIQSNPAIIDPLAHNLLIVDEPQSIPLEVMERLAAAGGGASRNDGLRFRQLLVLSATPRLSDPRWREIILGMIEPERMGLANAEQVDGLEYLARREDEAGRTLVGLAPDERARQGAIAYLTSATTRRISRQTRESWGAYLPVRDNHVAAFSPNGTEFGRLALINDWLAANPDVADLSAQPWPAIHAMLRARRSARAAIDSLGSRAGPNAAEVRRLTLEDPGDSRFEALLDILAARWLRDSEEKFIIVAGDAGTIDMLVTALPRFFPDLAGDGITTLKRPPAASEETALDIQQMHEAIEPFASGPARLLLIGDWVQAGLNLHHASENIIFYSLPWDPQAVDQLIGRIDRLRHNGLARARKGTGAGKVRIWRLVMRFSPEEAISAAMDAIRLFDRPLPQVPEEDMEKIRAIMARIARGISVSVGLAELRQLSSGWDARGLNSSLDSFDPMSVGQIIGRAERFAARPPIEPAMVRNYEGTPVDRAESANGAWVKVIGGTNDFQYGHRRDKIVPEMGFHTLWYAGTRPVPPFLIRDLGMANWMTDHAVFQFERRRLTSPPLRKVTTDAGEPDGRLLRFFDHGEVIHDDLIEGYRNLCSKHFGAAGSPPVVTVRLGEGHPALQFASRPVLLSVGYADPARALDAALLPEVLLRMAESAPTDAQRQRSQGDLMEFQDDLRADVRWLQDLLGPALILRASVCEGTSWRMLDPAEAALLLKPLGDDGEFKVMPKTLGRSAAVAPVPGWKQVLETHVSSITVDAREQVLARQQEVSAAVRSRLELIMVEMADLVSLRQHQVSARQALVVSESQKDFLRGQVTALEKRLLFAQKAAAARREILDRAVRDAMTGRMESLWHLIVRFVPPQQ